MEKLDLQRQRVNDWMLEQGACFAVVGRGSVKLPNGPLTPFPGCSLPRPLPIWSRD